MCGAPSVRRPTPMASGSRRIPRITTPTRRSALRATACVPRGVARMHQNQILRSPGRLVFDRNTHDDLRPPYEHGVRNRRKRRRLLDRLDGRLVIDGELGGLSNDRGLSVTDSQYAELDDEPCRLKGAVWEPPAFPLARGVDYVVDEHLPKAGKVVP